MARRPIEAVIEDPATPAPLRQQLERVQEVRRFAEELGLSVLSRYRHYTPWPGDRVVTTVVATPPGRVEPAGFWFPIVGRVPYKGYFDASRASADAERLRDDDHGQGHGEVAHHVDAAAIGQRVDQRVGDLLDVRPHALDDARRESLVDQVTHAGMGRRVEA